MRTKEYKLQNRQHVLNDCLEPEQSHDFKAPKPHTHQGLEPGSCLENQLSLTDQKDKRDVLRSLNWDASCLHSLVIRATSAIIGGPGSSPSEDTWNLSICEHLVRPDSAKS